jgi:hypothetical protein
MKLVHEIHNTKITGQQAAQQFAESQGREVNWLKHGTFQFVHGHNIYKLTISTTGWIVYLVTDGNAPEVTVTL